MPAGRKRSDKYDKDLRIKGATPEALAKTMFGGAKPRRDTRPKDKRTSS